jgi:Fe-S cluster assembly iron-binding protein IscA
MSYVMDFTSPDAVSADDTVLKAGDAADGLRLVCDPKSLLYLFGLQVRRRGRGVGEGRGRSRSPTLNPCSQALNQPPYPPPPPQLDYSSALIGGGFKFSNPNATETCGCGTSFTV